MAKNEFEELEEDFVPKQINSDDVVPVTQDGNKHVAAGSAGMVYDWTQAPTGTRQAPRKDLSGQIVTITKAEIILPPLEQKWDLTKDKTKETKFCTFCLHYDKEGQSEYYSGLRVFKRIVDGKEYYSHPTATRDRKNQASALLGAYADFKKKDINECSLHEFLAFLNSKPKAKIVVVTTTNPTTEKTVDKNLVCEFVNP